MLPAKPTKRVRTTVDPFLRQDASAKYGDVVELDVDEHIYAPAGVPVVPASVLVERLRCVSKLTAPAHVVAVREALENKVAFRDEQTVCDSDDSEESQLGRK